MVNEAPATGSAPPPRVQRAWAVLDGVPDPELPVVSVRDLGLVRAVHLEGTTLEVVLTPTYSGCPAIDLIEQQVLAALNAAGLGPLRVRLQRAPAWTTDWITGQGRAQLRAHGIAPPGAASAPLRFMPCAVRAAALTCPHCGGRHTECLSDFGATACKALYRCLGCREPFEYFKPL